VNSPIAFRVPPTAATPPLRFRERANARVGTAELLVFRVERERFAIDLQAVEETVESPQLHQVPESAFTVLGVFPHGDQLIPLYDVAKVLGMRSTQTSHPAGLVMRGGGRRIGIAVAEVEDVVKMELSSLRDVPDGAWDDDLLLGLFVRDGRLIALLDARALVSACQSPPVPEAL